MKINNPTGPSSINDSQAKHEPTLPSDLNQASNHYRYPGPDSFRDDETGRRIFFGRKDEVAEVFNRLLSGKLLVLFAKSGLGKTSLLQAGLFPKLREDDFLPISLRFNNRDKISLLEELQLAVNKVCKADKIAFSAGEGDTYWEYFNTALFSKGDRFLKPILILDQFEEIFTLQTEQYRLHLGEQLGDLVSGQSPDSVREQNRAGEKSRYPETSPNVRLLISLREDSVGALQELVPFIPGILSQRFRLTPLDRQRARTAIVNPAQISDSDINFSSRPFTYQTKTASQPDTGEAILDYLQDKRGHIEPFQLQLLCRHIELKVIQNQTKSVEPVIVDLQSYLGGQEGMATVINRFYQDALNKLSGWRVRRKSRALCETGLLNPEGRRESLSRSQIKQSFTLKQKNLDQLVEQKVLRREERLDSHAYELSHDSLAFAVFKARRSKVKFKWLALATLLILLFSSFAVWQWQQKEQVVNIANANLEEYKQQVKELVALDKPGNRTIKEPEMVKIPAGKFMMGTTEYKNETPVHQVSIPAFLMGAYEVTFEQYDQFAASEGYDLPDDKGWGRGKRPVISVSWDQAKKYADWLSEKTGKRYRLATEAEWEYAARAGTVNDYYWGDVKEDPTYDAWFTNNSERKTHPVGKKKPNAFRLYDMSGNVWEWVQDCYRKDYESAPKNGMAFESQGCKYRVLRGGSWYLIRDFLRSANRYRYDPDDRLYAIGFRLAQD